MSSSNGNRNGGGSLGSGRFLALRLSSDPSTGQLVYLPIRSQQQQQQQGRHGGEVLQRSSQHTNTNIDVGNDEDEDEDNEENDVEAQIPNRSTTHPVRNSANPLPNQTTSPGSNDSTSMSSLTNSLVRMGVREPGSGPRSQSSARNGATLEGSTSTSTATATDRRRSDTGESEYMIEQTASNLIQLLFGDYGERRSVRGASYTPSFTNYSESHNSTPENVRNLLSSGGPSSGVGGVPNFGSLGSRMYYSSDSTRRSAPAHVPQHGFANEPAEFVNLNLLAQLNAEDSKGKVASNVYSSLCGVGVGIDGVLSNASLKKHILGCLKGREFIAFE